MDNVTVLNANFNNITLPPNGFRTGNSPSQAEFEADTLWKLAFSFTCGIWNPSNPIYFNSGQVPTPPNVAYAGQTDGLKQELETIPADTDLYLATLSVGSRKDGFGASKILIDFYVDDIVCQTTVHPIAQGSGNFAPVAEHYLVKPADIGEKISVGFRAPGQGALQVAVGLVQVGRYCIC